MLKMEGIQTLKGSWPWPWPSIRPYRIPSCITHRPVPMYRISWRWEEKNFESQHWPSIGPYGISSCISHRPLPIYQISFKLKKFFVDGRTYGRTDISPLYIIRSTLGSSRPKNDRNACSTRMLAVHCAGRADGMSTGAAGTRQLWKANTRPLNVQQSKFPVRHTWMAQLYYQAWIRSVVRRISCQRFRTSVTLKALSSLHAVSQRRREATVHRYLQDKTPQYKSNYCLPVSEVASRQQLRSASRHQLLLIPRYRLSEHSAVGLLL